MKKRFIGIILLVVLVFCPFIGLTYLFTHYGPGSFDYSYDVGNGSYSLDRSSAHDIMITPKNGYHSEAEIIPQKVVEIAWNNRYVIAKQYGMKKKEENNTYEIPDEKVINYWILDTQNKVRYGPYCYEEFLEKLQELNIKNLKLKPVEIYVNRDGAK